MSEIIAPRISTDRPIYQQELEAIAGVDERVLCGPTAMLHLARSQGYDVIPQTFVRNLDWSHWNGGEAGWSRAGLGKMMRDHYNVASATWWTESTGAPFGRRSLNRMSRAGYIESPLERAFLQEVIPSLPRGTDGLMALVFGGWPVAARVGPGFGENKTSHAVVLSGLDMRQETVTVFDPDMRNPVTEYPVLYVREYVSAKGACTVVLPNGASAAHPLG